MDHAQLNQDELQVGQLASGTGLTVRALHHYDNIGLLKPSGRTASGYRLYNRGDIARLHQILALRRFGLPLAEIIALLALPDLPFSAIVAQQISTLGRQIEQAAVLRERLTVLQSQLNAGAEPDLTAWLSTLEMMTLFDKHFSASSAATIPRLCPRCARQSITSRPC